MSEEHTRDLKESRSFEERVFARFDAMEASINARFEAMESRINARFEAMELRFNARFDSLDARVQRLEALEERRAIETKPIWERALAEILEVRLRVDDVVRKLEVLSRDIIQVRADQLRLEDRVDKLDSKPV